MQSDRGASSIWGDGEPFVTGIPLRKKQASG
jgi:hypothetical protein